MWNTVLTNVLMTVGSILAAALAAALITVGSILAAALAAALITYVKREWTALTAKAPWLFQVQEVAVMAVQAAEQSGLAGFIEKTAEAKKGFALQLAQNWLDSIGVHVDVKMISAAIEAAVLSEFPHKAEAIGPQTVVINQMPQAAVAPVASVPATAPVPAPVDLTAEEDKTFTPSDPGVVAVPIDQVVVPATPAQ